MTIEIPVWLVSVLKILGITIILGLSCLGVLFIYLSYKLHKEYNNRK